MVIALAGRRIDAPDTSAPSFPAENIEAVRERLHALLHRQNARTLVCSAACGADLIALQEAGALGVRRRVVLPFEAERFRTTSVVDRPGDWGSLYDQILTVITASGDLVVLASGFKEDAAYAATNHAILDEAAAIAQASGDQVLAVLVWDESPRDALDLTQAFGDAAQSRGFPVLHVNTI